MNKDQISGKVEQLIGKVKQKAGESTGNQRIANQGVADQIRGSAKETWGHIKDTANEIKETAEAKHQADQDRARDSIASGTQSLKDRIADNLDNIQNDQRVEREHIKE
ncbi:hypothetical protein GCM10011507_30060 [Edaphobacter acidisoli]|uniref:CsbD-like domain-containing protein n=1 Tax=Edaphobacter acidisoli TaxID=2040573 RepID=A0A916S1B7_9BACT|nr:CsbD family protein [Edaphobacter acidisoli]GGA76753.1 hypothetical protein GCM10011507_30060 [Edaphobacter acidisoli]